MDQVDSSIENGHKLKNKRTVAGLLVITVLLVSGVIFLVLNSKNSTSSELDVSGVSLEQAGDYAGAAEVFIDEANSAPDDVFSPAVYEQAGDSYMKVEDYDNAITAYEKAKESYLALEDEDGVFRMESKIRIATDSKVIILDE